MNASSHFHTIVFLLIPKAPVLAPPPKRIALLDDAMMGDSHCAPASDTTPAGCVMQRVAGRKPDSYIIGFIVLVWGQHRSSVL